MPALKFSNDVPAVYPVIEAGAFLTGTMVSGNATPSI